jgi:hypothetical protein
MEIGAGALNRQASRQEGAAVYRQKESWLPPAFGNVSGRRRAQEQGSFAPPPPMPGGGGTIEQKFSV